MRIGYFNELYILHWLTPVPRISFRTPDIISYPGSCSSSGRRYPPGTPDRSGGPASRPTPLPPRANEQMPPLHSPGPLGRRHPTRSVAYPGYSPQHTPDIHPNVPRIFTQELFIFYPTPELILFCPIPELFLFYPIPELFLFYPIPELFLFYPTPEFSFFTLAAAKPPIKHMSFHSYLRKLCSGGGHHLGSLTDLRCTIAPGCTVGPGVRGSGGGGTGVRES